MVKRIGKFLLYMLFFIFALIAFSPKESLYFLLEENIKKFDVIISEEVLQEHAFSLDIKNLHISAKGVDSATIQEANIHIFLLSNSIEMHDIELSSLVNSFLPAKIQSVKISYTLFNPLYLTAESLGKFGRANIDINLLKRELTLHLKPSKKMLSSYQNSLRMFKKQTNGEYTYVKTF